MGLVVGLGGFGVFWVCVGWLFCVGCLICDLFCIFGYLVVLSCSLVVLRLRLLRFGGLDVCLRVSMIVRHCVGCRCGYCCVAGFGLVVGFASWVTRN